MFFPHLEIPYLLCSYLPGIPLSLTLYFWFYKLGKEPIALFFNTSNNYTYPYLILILYLFILPLTIGLLIDGLRHWIEEVSVKRKDPIANKIFWPYHLKEKMVPKGIDENILKLNLSKYAILYQLYEFSFNLFISLSLSFLLLKSFNIFIYLATPIIIVIPILIFMRYYDSLTRFTLILLACLISMIPLISYIHLIKIEIDFLLSIIIYIFILISFLLAQLFKNMFRDSINDEL